MHNSAKIATATKVAFLERKATFVILITFRDLLKPLLVEG